MHRNLFALAAMLAVLATGIDARAACTAANPNANVAESTPTTALTDNGDGTVTHSLTGLMWKQCAEGLSGAGCATGGATTMRWSAALAAAKNSTFAGYSDWRLPNKKELESIVENCGYNPSINRTRFPATPASRFWSGSSYAPSQAFAWLVNFTNGDTYAGNKPNSDYVRLVRGGQPFDSFDAQPGIAYSATTFTEAAANDGSIATSVTLTLSKDTYVADVVSANRISASNVPVGLAVNFVRDGNTQITATLTGNATNHASANDIATLTFTFADGAFTTTGTAANVTNYAKNNLVVDFADPPVVAYSATTFSEAAANDGSIATSVTLTVSGDTYAGTVVSANKITASNVPVGLTANFVRDSNTQITATLTGNATNHADTNDIANLTFSFADGAFTTTGTAANVTNYAKNNLLVDFNDPAADTTPDAFSFTAQTGAALSTATTSNAITVEGINSAAAISIVGGSYAVNGAAYTTGAGTVNNGNTVTVKLTSSGSYSTAATATLTIGGVSAAFGVTTQAAPAPVYYAPPAPTLIVAPSGGTVTLTGTTPVTASPGSTLIIPAGAALSGTVITLSTTGGTAGAPVTIKIGTHTLTVTPLGDDAVLMLKTVTIDGVTTLVLALVSGTVSVAVGPGQPVIMFINGGMIIAGNSGGTVSQTMNGDGTATLSVTSGYVILPANAFTAVTIQDNKLYAGEIAQIGSDGTVTGVRLGSLEGGSAGSVGDPIAPPTAPNLVFKAKAPKLDGSVARLGGDLGAAIVDQTGSNLKTSITGSVQNTWGIVPLTFPGGVQMYALPVGEIIVDSARADGLTQTARNQFQIVKNGIVTTFSPMVADPGALLRAAAMLFSSSASSLAILEDGLLHLQASGVTYVMQPGWAMEKTGDPAGITSNAQLQAVYTDEQGQRQVLHPVFADLGQLTKEMKILDANATLTANSDGSVSMKLLGVVYNLTPDYALVAVPAAHAGDVWWLDGAKVYVRNSDGKAAQGFAVK